MRQIEELKKFQTGRIEVRERGPYGRDQLAERMASIDWVLVPSTWWEIFGLVVSEGLDVRPARRRLCHRGA